MQEEHILWSNSFLSSSILTWCTWFWGVVMWGQTGGPSTNGQGTRVGCVARVFGRTWVRGSRQRDIWHTGTHRVLKCDPAGGGGGVVGGSWLGLHPLTPWQRGGRGTRVGHTQALLSSDGSPCHFIQLCNIFLLKFKRYILIYFFHPFNFLKKNLFCQLQSYEKI